MLKKIALLVCAILCIGGCTANTTEKAFDSDFMKALAKGLDSRWKDSNKNEGSAKYYSDLIELELKEVDGYQDKKFENEKLKELVLRYINELKEGKKITEDFGASDWDDTWNKHQNRRKELLLQIQEIQEIPVKDVVTLKELLSEGREVKNENEKLEAIKSLMSNVKFEVDQEKSNQFSTLYFAVVENTTEYDIKTISISVTLKDSEDVNYYTTYINQANWKKGTKVRLEFTDFDNKATGYELNLNYMEASKP